MEAKTLSLKELEVLLSKLNGSGNEKEWRAIKKLREHFGDALASQLYQKYKKSALWNERSACVYYATPYVQNADTLNLGMAALSDRSKIVRYRACVLLAHSQNMTLLNDLEKLARTGKHKSQEDLLAVIDAIKNQNQNYFVDRNHSGMILLTVNGLDK